MHINTPTHTHIYGGLTLTVNFKLFNFSYPPVCFVRNYNKNMSIPRTFMPHLTGLLVHCNTCIKYTYDIFTQVFQFKEKYVDRRKFFLLIFFINWSLTKLSWTVSWGVKCNLKNSEVRVHSKIWWQMKKYYWFILLVIEFWWNCLEHFFQGWGWHRKKREKVKSVRGLHWSQDWPIWLLNWRKSLFLC